MKIVESSMRLSLKQLQAMPVRSIYPLDRPGKSHVAAIVMRVSEAEWDFSVSVNEDPFVPELDLARLARGG